MTDLHTLRDLYIEARDFYEDAKQRSDNLYRDMKGIENKLVNLMLENEDQSLKRADGTMISLRRSTTCSVTEANSEDVRNWLVENYGDDSDFVRETVHKPSVLELIKRELDADKEDGDFPEWLKVSSRPTLTLRRGKQ